MSGGEPREDLDREAFTTFLNRGGRSSSAIQRCLRMVDSYLQFMAQQYDMPVHGEAGPEQLTAFVAWVEREPKASAKTQLWALRYYYQFLGDEEMAGHAAALRRQRVKRKPFVLANFRGVRPDHAEALADEGVRDVKQMLEAGATRSGRKALAQRTGVPYESILELVKLSDLARLPGVKAIRARLYYDAGADTLDKLASWDPEELRVMLLAFVEETGFDGIAPLPKEAANAVATARRLPRLVSYEEGEAQNSNRGIDRVAAPFTLHRVI